MKKKIKFSDNDVIDFDCNRIGFIQAVSYKESSSDLSQPLSTRRNISSALQKNDKGYIGFFQFGEAALIDLGYYQHWDNNTDKTKANDWTGTWTGKAGINNLSQFLNSPNKQIQIINEWIDLLCKRLRNRNFNEYYGKIINGVEITESGAIAGAHLVGDGGLGSFLGVSGFKGEYKEYDGNDVHISKYIEMFNHYDLETCCNRKLYICLKNQFGQLLKNKNVIVESEYRGKFKQPKFVVNMTSDDNGWLPVILRHPQSNIIVKLNGKQSKTIVQESDRKQSFELSINENIEFQAVLAAQSIPEKKEEQVVVVEQTAQKNKSGNHLLVKKEDVTFDIAIIEGDTRKK